MSATPRFRLSALIAGVAVIAATVLPAFPAVADDAPAPDPTSTVAPVETPAPDATPTPEPTPDATPDVTPTPDATPTEEPTADPAPTSTPQAVETVSYSGILNRIADETTAAGVPSLVLSVTGRGYLLVDASGLPQANRGGKITASIVVPAGLTLSSDADARFTQLANYSTSVKPLALSATVSQAAPPKQGVSALVSQTPVTTATHKVYVVLVSPKEKQTKASNQTAAEAATLVQAADTYWNAQSSGTIDFSLAGTASWYKSAYSCKTNAGSTSLWNQASSVAKSKLGYVQGPNSHLVLLFPYNTNCGGAIGLGTIGWSVNQGGVAWVVGGNNLAIRKATITHELGHNLSLGHADWLECDDPSPFVGATAAEHATSSTNAGITGCDVNHYGDLVDVMGYGDDGKTGGALSSAAAIRSGIWPASAWVQAAVGTNNYTINAVSSNTGPRSVVISDPDGTQYFVEFRNFTGVDAQYAPGACTNYSGSDGGACPGEAAGVRVLRFEPSGFDTSTTSYNGYQGLPGYDDFLIGREVGGLPKVTYQLGDVFYSQGGTSGIKVTVTNITATQATIQVVRSTHANQGGDVYVESTRYYDGTYRVGDTLTAFLADYWDAEAVTYQWRSRFHGTVAWTNIVGATGSSYVLTPNDVGQDIEVVVTGTRSGQSNVSGTGVLGMYQGEGSAVAVAQGIYIASDPGTVAVDNSTGAVKAVDSNFPASHTAFSYQWYRGTTKIPAPAGTGQFYNLTSADANQAMKVVVTTTIPGYSNSVVRTSPARNLTIKTSNTATALTVFGTPQPGQTLNITNGLIYVGDTGALTPDGYTYQWLRSGVAIAGATASSYLVQSADYGKKITVKVTATKAGWVSNTVSSATGPTINLPGVLVHVQNASVTGTGLTKTVNALINDVAAQGQPTWYADKITYQWYRNNVAIKGATLKTYTLSQSLDYGKEISVRIGYSRLGYGTYYQYGVTTSNGLGDYWIRANSTVPVLLGDVKVGNTLTIDPRTYFDMGDGSTINSGITELYQWYRSGVAIPVGQGGTADHYQLAPADKGKTITVKMTVTATCCAFELPSISTSAHTPVVGTELLPGYDQPAPTLSFDASSTDFKTVLTFSGTGITKPTGTTVNNVVKYQWYRDNTAISGATSSKYTLTQTDRNHSIKLRIITSHAAVGSRTFTTDTRYTNAHDYTLLATASSDLFLLGGNPYAVGTQIDAGLPSLTDAVGSSVSSTARSKQWYRNGVAIPAPSGVTTANNPYTLVAADGGKKVTVKMTIGSYGYIPVIITETTPNPSDVVAAGTLVGAGVAGTVTMNNPVTNELLATPATVTAVGGAPSATFAYQWLRNGANITGATSSKYKLTAADWGKNIRVRITSSLAGYTSDSTQTPDVDYSITQKVGDEPYPSGSSWSLGTQVTMYNYDTFTTKDGDLTTGTVTFQWLRAGVPITGATSESYVIQAADYNKLLTMRYTVTEPGYVPLVFTTVGYVVGKGVTLGNADGYTDANVTIVAGSGLGTLKAQVNDIYPATPTPTYTYKWYRGATAISGATASTYKLVAADKAQQISVKVVMTRVNFTVPMTTLTSAAADYSIYAGAALPTISGTAAVGRQLTASPSDFYDDAAKSMPASGVDYVYTWYRSGAAIAGATTPTYTLTASDLSKKISVKVTAVGPGRLAASGATSLVTSTVAVGTIDPGTLVPSTAINLSTRKATIAFTGTSTTPSVAKAYQWYRNGAAISGATASSFVLATTDTNKSISVVIKLTKSGFTTYLYAAAPGLLVNGLASDAEAVAVTGGTDTTNGTAGQTLSCVAPFYYRDHDFTKLVQPGTIAGDTQSIAWTRDGSAIAGETSYNYTVLGTDAGHTISCVVTTGSKLYKTLVDTSANVLTIS